MMTLCTMIVPRLLLLALVVGNAVAGSVAIGTNSTVESSTLLRRRAQQESDELSAQHDDHRALKGVDSKTVDRYKAVPKGYRKNPSYYSETYLRRAGEYHDFKALAKEWGSWTLPALSSNQKVDESFYQGFPNRDVPRHDFPSSAWQVDKNYLSKFLPEAMALTERAMEAILSEYGFGKNENKDQTFDERSVNFRLYSDKSNPTGGGWMPPSSYQGLQRRLLHAVMTQDRFSVAMSGHSAAAAHGNHFQQSYTLQIQKIMEPIMARLGVKMWASNFGSGGLGTLQTGLAAASLMGPDTDIIMWDSGMTEKDGPPTGILALQSLLGGNRAPLLWFAKKEDWLLGPLAEKTGADIAGYGSGKGATWPKIESEKDIDKVAWAARYLACPKELKEVCQKEKYISRCWINRTGYTWEGIDLSIDVEDLPSKQSSFVAGRAGWHPGIFQHQIQGRRITFGILQALFDALKQWKNAPDFAVPDSAWHVTDYYKKIKDEVVAHASDWTGWCENKKIPLKFCTHPAQARTEFTPRYNAWETSLRSIISGGQQVQLNPSPNLYDPPDPFNPSLHPPEGEIDVLAIVENGVDFAPNLARIRDSARDMRGVSFTEKDMKDAAGSKHNPKIKPGKGWDKARFLGMTDNCDGQYDSFCVVQSCGLSGQNDERSGLRCDGFSGWLIFNLPNVKQGVIMARIQTWVGEVKATRGWCSENDEKPCKGRSLSAQSQSTNVMVAPANATTVSVQSSNKEQQQQQHRRLKTPLYCDEFKLEVAINGKITTYNLEEVKARINKAQRVVELFEFMNDDKFSQDGKPRDVELALRITGCGRQKNYDLSHLYWI